MPQRSPPSTARSVPTTADPRDVTVDAVADSTAAGDCRFVQPEIDFRTHDLLYLTVQYVPMQGESHLLYHKYLKLKKAQSPKEQREPASPAIMPVDKLVTTIDMKIFRGSNRELVGSLSRSIELPNALPNLQAPGVTRSLETAGASGIFSLTNIMTERLVQEANAAVAGIPGFHSVFFGLHRVLPGGRFKLVSRRIQPISCSQSSDFFTQGVITTDHRSETWPHPGHLHLEFRAPPLGRRRESLGQNCAQRDGAPTGQ